MYLDVKYGGKKFKEDKDYIEHKELRENIRRGNTLLLYLKPKKGQLAFDSPYMYLDLEDKKERKNKNYANDKGLREEIDGENTLLLYIGEPGAKSSIVCCPSRINYEVIDMKWIRRGFKKFFDIKLEYVQQSNTKNLDKLGSFAGNYPKLSGTSESEILRHTIFFEAENAILREEAAIDIYKTNKANGENAQISYVGCLDSWVISSKSVSLLARALEDLERYRNDKTDRYKFSLLIAEAWFGILETMPQETVSELKREIEGFTLTGEYVGNPKFQHLVTYNEIQILFYAMVQNDSSESTVPPLKAFTLFKKYGLDHVPIVKLGSFQSISEMYSALEGTFRTTSSEELDVGEEGSVLYIVKNSDPASPVLKSVEDWLLYESPLELSLGELGFALSGQTTLSLCKLKTLEYRIFRKLREKISHEIKDTKKVFSIFENEIKNLSRGFELPKPLDYYVGIAGIAFEFAKKHRIDISDLRPRYLSLLQKFIDKFNGGESPELTPRESEEVKEVSRTPSPEVPPTGIVLFTPPLYFTMQEIEVIIQNLGCSSFETSWHSKAEFRQGMPLCLVNNVVSVGNSFKENAILVFCGYNEEGIEKSLERLNTARKERKKEPVPPTVQSFLSTKPKDLQKRLNNQLDSIRNIRENSKAMYPDYIVESNSEPLETTVQKIKAKLTPQEKPNTPQEPLNHSQNLLYVVLPIGIPAMGKSFLINSLLREQLGCSFSVVSSDKVRAKCMEEYMQRNQKADKKTAFEKTAKPARKQFFQQVAAALVSNHYPHIVFLDKNHPPNAIDFTLNEVRKNKPSQVNLKFVMLTPYCRDPFVLNMDSEFQQVYPFSLSMLVQCLLRARDRDLHETLDGDVYHKMAVVLMMFQLYQGFTLDHLSEGFDFRVEVPFTDEDHRVNPDLKDMVENVLNCFKPNSLPKKHQIVNLVETLMSFGSKFKQVNSSEQFVTELRRVLHRVEESKTQEAKETKMAPKKLPVYIGVDLEPQLSSLVFPLVLSALEELRLQFPSDKKLQKDLRELLETLPTHFRGGEYFAESWKFTNSLHMTSLFIGGNRSLVNSQEYLSFSEGDSHMLKLTHLVYVPRELVCSATQVLTELKVANRVPHVTMMLAKSPAKTSNEVLAQVKLKGEVHSTEVSIRGKTKTAYCLPLQPKLMLKGLSKGF
eukprot:CAMPEP_0202430446 /NCGR_PEP_ID=MMETSP1345-20130828/3886_1 /ASSEMBLY_ACC=CAM_ASM_000843 /TAXON_ID=342563 /ORGANISM="Fabrea Fabrea salina" /LENGTH=1162 /DNA_ID=CAMNT_0049041933 /DNA_START=84 /DNA_END=3572 /DNA_ORIENTATION=+